MGSSVTDEEWAVVSGLLPEGWRELASETGALRRERGVDSPDTLLRLILLHVAAGLSLRQTVARARASDLASISDVALMYRLRNSERWLSAMTTRLLAANGNVPRLPELPRKRKVRIIDATTIEEPGATGTNWRVHYALQLPTLACDYFEVTDAKGAESYVRSAVQEGDLILGDRAYASRGGVGHVLAAHADVVVRLTARGLPLMDEDGTPFVLAERLRTLHQHEPGEWPVRFKVGQDVAEGRLCAIRLSAAASERTKRRKTKRANRRQKTIGPEALEMAEYVAVLTTASSDEIDTTQVLELYRARWQVELAFKRLKSLLGAGHVPKYDPAAARAWIQAKLLSALLIERLMHAAQFISPWGFELSTPKRMA